MLTIIQEIERAAAKAETRIALKGRVAHQGDVYVHPIAKRPEAWDVLVTNHRQVAVGDTVGSRHIAEGDVSVYWPKIRTGISAHCPLKAFFPEVPPATVDLLIGPVVESAKEWMLTHPEHAHHRIPAGIYLVTYQLDLSTLRAVRD